VYLRHENILWTVFTYKNTGRGRLYKAGRPASSHSVTVQLNVRIGETSDRSDFEHCKIVGASRVGSSTSETAGLLGFSCTTVSTVYEKGVTKTTMQSCG
jgi:hypothetical protein